MAYQVLLLANGTLVTITLRNNDPESIRINREIIPGLTGSNQSQTGSQELILSSSGSESNLISILPRSRLSVITGFDRGDSKIQQV